jgi:hypothetical protein
MDINKYIKPNRKKKMISLTLDAPDLAAIQAEAKANNVSVCAFIRALWKAYDADKIELTKPRSPTMLDDLLSDRGTI